MAKLDILEEVAEYLQERVLCMIMLGFDEISFLVFVEWDVALLAKIDHGHERLVSDLGLHRIRWHSNRLLRLSILVAFERTERLQQHI